jgi:DNA-binding CsgD family transcriptional regulator/PAS domain-containing protein
MYKVERPSAARPAALEEAPSHRPGAAVEDRLEFEALLSDISAALLATPPEKVEPAVEAALWRVRDLLGADRCVLLAVSADLRRVVVRVASYGPGVAPVPSELNLVALFPWAHQHLLLDRAPARAGTLADLPPEAVVDRMGWERLAMVSCLTLPLDAGGRIRYLLMLQTVRQERRWADSEVLRLRVLGELVVGALERMDMLTTLRRAEARLRSGSELAGLGFFELDFNAKTAFADDRLRELCGLPAGQSMGLEAVEHWENHLHPDDRSRVLTLRQQMLDGRLERYSVEYRFQNPSLGPIRIHHLAQASRRDHAGRALATYGAFRAVSGHRRTEEEMADFGRQLLRNLEEERARLRESIPPDLQKGPQRAGDPVDHLTPRQLEVLKLLALGHSAKEIASALSISTRTVEYHKYQMMETLGLHTKAELMHFAIKQHLVEI